MALVDKNQPMREAEIAIADFINTRLINLVQQFAIPGNDSIAIEQLDENVKNLQTIIDHQDITFKVAESSDRLLMTRVTVKNNQEAVEGTDWKYVFNGAFASLNAEYTDKLKQNPVFVTTSVESVTSSSVTIAVILFIMSQQDAGTVFKATLSTVWNCTQVLPI